MDVLIKNLWSALWPVRFRDDAPRLRFELGGEELDNSTQQVPRFLQAHRRACSIADEVFQGRCIAVVAWGGPKQNIRPGGDEMDGFDALYRTGMQARQLGEWQATLDPDPDADPEIDPVLAFRSYDLTGIKAYRDTLLWHSVAQEMPIYPSSAVVTFLIDPDASTLLHVYDDRGMDMIADGPWRLRATYEKFSDWLLDFDRDRMAKLFW